MKKELSSQDIVNTVVRTGLEIDDLLSNVIMDRSLQDWETRFNSKVKLMNMKNRIDRIKARIHREKNYTLKNSRMPF